MPKACCVNVLLILFYNLRYAKANEQSIRS